MELTLELELPDGSLRPVTVLGAERPTIAQVERRLAQTLAGEGGAHDPDSLRLRAPRLERDLLGPRTLVREGIEDGERLQLRSAGAPAGRAPVAARSSTPAGRPAVPVLLGAVVVGAAIAFAAVGVAASLRDDPATAEPPSGFAAADAAEPASAPVSDESYVEDGSAAVDEEPAVSEDYEEDPAPVDPETINAGFDGGEWVQLASFRSSENAWSEALRLSDAGIDTTVIDSGDAVELFPGFQVVAAGPFTDEADGRRTLRRARAAGIPDAKARTLTPAETALDIASVAGSYAGEIDLIDTEDPARNRTLAAELFVGEDGAAVLRYERSGCVASLEHAGLERAVGTWDQVSDSGGCLKGGTWSLKLSGSELLMGWERDGSRRWMAGRLERDGDA